MRTFIYKSLIIAFLAIIVFKFTISKTLQDYEKKIYENFSREKIEFYKIKIREEMKNAIKKDDYLKAEDARLINQFLEKIKSEISAADKN